MKPHLPTALRRALLAVIALLSPSVVTTTISTATLTVITAPAIAEDLTITETQITEDITYNNVTVSSSSAHLYSTTKNANFTAGTLTVDSNGKLVVGSTSYDGSSRFNFYASKFEIETGGSITFVENPQVYATDTLYDLLVGVKQDDSIRVHNTNVYGAGHKDLTSEFLTSKIRHYMVRTNCYLTLTSGDLAINSSFEDDLLTFWVYVGDGNAENGEAKATIADGVEIAHTDTSKKNRLYGLAIYRDGSLNVGKGNNALTLANCDIGGKMVSNRDIVFSNTYFRASNGDYKYSEADVTVNGKITFANTNSSTTTVYGSLTANGEIAIEGNNYIKLNSSTVLNLGGKINNSGSLTLGGTINLNAANFTHSTVSSFDDVAYNGYEVTTTTYLGVITGTGTVTGSATWKVGGNTATYNAGDVTVTTTDKSTYRVSSGNVDLSTVLESNDTNKILLCGGNLVVNTDISSLIPEITTVDGAASTVTINTSLNQNALTATDDKTITLCGTGSYVINGTDLSLGTGIMISDSEWSGTVKTTGATAVSGAVNTSVWNNTELNGTTMVNNGATLTLGGNTKLNGLLENNGSVVLGGAITVDPTAFAVGTRERYSDENNGYKIIDTTYTVLTGGAATGSATWKVGTQSATYEDGMVIVDGIEDTAVYYVRNGDVAYTRALANDTTTFSLDAGHLVLNESLKDTQSIEWKSTASWLNINNNAVELKSSQLSTVGAGNFTLIAPDGGTYIIDKKVGDIVELTLGTGVTLSDEHWWGWVKTVGDTTVSSDLDTTGWKNTELNGTTTVGEGTTLTLGGDVTLKGQIANSGTLTLSGNITIDVASFADGTVTELAPQTYQQGSSLASTTSGFATGGSIKIDLVTGNAAAVSGANWTVGNYKEFSFDGNVLFGTVEQPGTEFFVNDAVSYQKENAIFTNANGEKATELVLNGGVLTLESDLEDGLGIRAGEDGTVVVGGEATLNAGAVSVQSGKEISLTGDGTYTMSENANTLGTGVLLAEGGWTGTVKVNGAADALELGTLGTTGSTIDLGGADHTLATGDHTVTAKVEGENSSLTMNGGTLTLRGTTTLEGVYGADALSATDATISNGLTVDSISGDVTVSGGMVQEKTSGEAIIVNGELTLGSVTLCAVLNNGGEIVFDGRMRVDSSAMGDSSEKIVYEDNSGTENNAHGFRKTQIFYTVVTGAVGAVTDNASWTVDDAIPAIYAGGKVTTIGVIDSTTYWLNANSGDYELSSAQANLEAGNYIALNGGTLLVDTALTEGVTISSIKDDATGGTVNMKEGMELSRSNLEAAEDRKITLTGSGAYLLEGNTDLGAGVELSDAWTGTVYTGELAAGMALDAAKLGTDGSTLWLGNRPMRRNSGGAEVVLKNLTSANVGDTVVPGALTLQAGASTTQNLEVQGMLTLGTADSSASLTANGVVTLQGLTFGHADSTMQAEALGGVSTLDVQLAEELLGNKQFGTTLTLVTLTQEGFDGAALLNGEDATGGIRSTDNRREFTLDWNEDGTILTLTVRGAETYVTEQVKPATGNGKVGVALLTDVFLNDTPAKGGALDALLDSVDAGTLSDRDAAAVAGASTAVLGQALSGDVERQLRAIRNRSITGAYGHDAVALNHGKRGAASMTESNRYFAWVNAEGNRAEQNADGCAAGYTLSSWGGTVGAGMQVNNQLTLGLALTAMYGDLQSDGPDSLDGDMDTAYLSAFARYNRGRWSHAFIGTVGTMEADYKRTAMGYSNTGDTEGTAFGLMYELSRNYALSNNSSISSVFNISYRHIAVDGYSERGTDAALNVGEQSLDTVTVGAGARYAAVLGQQTLNRACAFEARALAKYDFGDTQTDTNVGFINHVTRSGSKSAELGAFGVELGAGISVPVGSGSIFADGAVELRSDYTNFNATVGYKIQF